MKTLTTAKGHTFDCEFFAEASVGVLYTIVNNTTLTEVATILSDTEELEELHYVETNGDEVIMDETKTGYTILVSINQMPSNAIRIGLRRPYVGEFE